MQFTLLACFILGGFLSLLFGSIFLVYSQRFFRSQVREYTPENHKKKNNTPTMGGMFFLLAAFCAVWLTGFFDARLLIVILALVGFAGIGFFDDWAKINKSQGISARAKFIAQWAVALLVCSLLVMLNLVSTQLYVPLLQVSINLGYAYIVWSAFVVVACANAVNLTDGLDGLATGVIIPPLILFGGISLACSWPAGLLFAACLTGALVGFLWFNAYPARVFMGDIGSLPLGAGLALLALVNKQELLIPIAGGVFLLEELSVMLQVISFKYRRKRIFKMAPVHHHFELSGWSEVAIVTSFSAASALLSLCAWFMFTGC